MSKKSGGLFSKSKARPGGRSRAERKQRAAEMAALTKKGERPAHKMQREELSQEAVLAYLAEHGNDANKRDLAKHFGLKGNARLALKSILKDIENEGLVERTRGGRFRAPGHLPSVMLCDMIERDADGEWIAAPAEWPDDDAPKIIIARPAKPRIGEPVPGVGDRVLVRLEDTSPGQDELSGRVIKIIGKKPRAAIGIFRASPDGSGRFVPVDKKALGHELIVLQPFTNNAKDGDLIAVSIGKEARIGPPQARVLETLGSIKSEKAISLIAIHAHGIPHQFPAAVIAESEKAKPATLAGREDWRDVPLITIDPVDAKDHDDAVYAHADENEKNPGGHVVIVAIADVAAYVKPGSAMDREALFRGNSVYFPDRVVPMLPEQISNNLCSLRENEDRPALAVKMILDKNGDKKSHSFHRIMMRSRAKLAYEQAQAAIHGRTDEKTAPILNEILRPLWSAYAAASAARDRRAPLDLNLPERKLKLKPDGSVETVITPQRLDAHRLIEEFMILANVAAAETLERAGSQLIYRVHDEPSLEKIRALGEILASVNLKLTATGAVRPALFNHILDRVKETPHAPLLNEMILRTQAQAEYAAENYGHFGLNLRRYAHFTSPIRRYADLVVHRALIAALRLGKDGLPEETTRAHLAEVAASISAAERRAMAAERETVDRLIAHYLADRIGATFQGRITGVTRAGLFVRLAETGADGFVPASTLGVEYYIYDEAHHALTSERSGESYRLGDDVEVKLVEAIPVAGALRFEMLSQGRKGLPLPSRGGRRTSRGAGALKRRPSPKGSRGQRR